jgi:hypothetical protein
VGDSREKLLTRVLREYDRKLYAKREGTGAIHVYREGTGFYPFEYDGKNFLASYPTPYFVLALTDTWTVRGTPVEWGIEPLITRIREIDVWHDDAQASRLVEAYKKKDRQNEKDLRNKNEAFFREQRSEFKKAFKDINTSQMTSKRS